jgi:hypothetical protein
MTYHTETLDHLLDLEPLHAPRASQGYTVIHPLHDAPEAKCSADRLGPMKLTPGCRLALVAVRFYLVAIMVMGAYRVVTLMGTIKH